MISEVITGAYDFEGRRTYKPNFKRAGFRPTYPFGAYVSQPLSMKFGSINDLRRFLATCRYVSDEDQFGKPDYWLAPQDFEKTRKGDCEDFALYAWRQLMAMGYPARLVAGRAGRNRRGHAWVQFEKHGRQFLMEPLAPHVAGPLPRMSLLRYEPVYSAAWDGKRINFYLHEDRIYDPPLSEAFTIFFEWLLFWVKFWIRTLVGLPVRALPSRSMDYARRMMQEAEKSGIEETSPTKRGDPHEDHETGELRKD